eukprot:8234965-Pyramimonas_sp.AAC.1
MQRRPVQKKPSTRNPTLRPQDKTSVDSWCGDATLSMRETSKPKKPRTLWRQARCLLAWGPTAAETEYRLTDPQPQRRGLDPT